VERDEQTAPVIPSYASENKTPNSIKDADHIEKLVTDMGGAIDVIRVSTQNDDQLEEAKETALYNKGKEYSDIAYSKHVLNISIFNHSSEDFAIESNSSRLEGNEGVSESKVKSDKVSSSVMEQGDRPVPPTTGTDDFLEYRADDSDRVYAVRNYEDRDPDTLLDGSSTQQNLSDTVEAADSEAAAESEIPTQLEEHTAEEIRVR
jgi:hypothetical protein